MSSYIGVWKLPTTWAVDFQQLTITVEGRKYGNPKCRSTDGEWRSLNAGQRESVAQNLAMSDRYKWYGDLVWVVCPTRAFPTGQIICFYRIH